MLHEILLSLSGHPSPFLRADDAGPQAAGAVSPPERALLASVARLGELHARLRSYAAQMAAAHPSTICRAVATAVEATHLAAFQRKVLEVEEAVLRGDAGLVGAHNIVPLTAVVGEFAGWSRRMEWLWEIVHFMSGRQQGATCRGAQLIDRLRTELQSGYADIERTVISLVTAAETAWLKQVSAWILYGRLPSFGGDDFFVQRAQGSDQDYTTVPELMPSFVTPSTAATMLFVGKSLNHARVKASIESGPQGLDHLSSQLDQLAALTFPLNTAAFSRAMTAIRQSLSRNTLQKLLPLTKVVEILRLLRDFFLLGRGEFAMALTHEADEKIRGRWRRADNLAYEKRDGLSTVVVKEGEVAAVLARTWAVMGALQGQHADEDEGLELARDLLRLHLTKSKPATPLKLGNSKRSAADVLTPTPFRNLLLSTPVVLSLQIPSPLDMFLTPADLQVYTAVNSYLLSIRRAHIRLTDLWKVTELRRHHPAPPGPPAGSTRSGRSRVVQLRRRYAARASTMRGVWVTCSAAIFFLAETEAYLQAEVVAGLWDGFHAWLVGDNKTSTKSAPPTPRPPEISEESSGEDDDIWLGATRRRPAPTSKTRPDDGQPQHDPQTVAAAHGRFLSALARRLLLTQEAFTAPLYALLVDADHLVALVRRLHGVWTSADLEADAGVVDAFADLERDEADIKAQLCALEDRVRAGIEHVVAALRLLEADSAFMAQLEPDAGGDDEAPLREEGEYLPRRVGGIDRLLMKLDFGVWFGSGKGGHDDGDDF